MGKVVMELVLAILRDLRNLLRRYWPRRRGRPELVWIRRAHSIYWDVCLRVDGRERTYRGCDHWRTYPAGHDVESWSLTDELTRQRIRAEWRESEAEKGN